MVESVKQDKVLFLDDFKQQNKVLVNVDAFAVTLVVTKILVVIN